MSDFPSTHTTATTTTTATSSSTERKIFVNTAYLKTWFGRLKIAHLVICLVVFICTMVSQFPRSDRANWISFVAMGGFWTTAVLLFLFVINVVSYVPIIPWLLLQLVYCGIWTFFYFVAGCVAADGSSKGYGDAFAAAAFFCFLAMLIYGFHAFLLFKTWREGGSAFTVTVTSSTITTGGSKF